MIGMSQRTATILQTRLTSPDNSAIPSSSARPASMECELEPGFRALAVLAAALGSMVLAGPSVAAPAAAAVNSPTSALAERCAALPRRMSGKFPDVSTHLTAASVVDPTAIQAGGAGGPPQTLQVPR